MESRRPIHPVYPTRQRVEGIDSRPHLVEAALITMNAGLMLFRVLKPEMVKADLPDISEIDYCSRYEGFDKTHMSLASNGFVLFKNTRRGLSDMSHRLKVPTNGGDPEYHREPFNVDAQCLTPPTINLTGIVEISRNPEAVVEVLAFERDIVYSGLLNWENCVNKTANAISCSY